MFAGDFRVNLDETRQTLLWFNLQRDGTGNGLSNIQGNVSRKCAGANVSSAPKYEHLPIFKAGLSISYDGWAKCKEKVPDASDPNQNVETTCNSKLKFT